MRMTASKTVDIDLDLFIHKYNLRIWNPSPLAAMVDNDRMTIR